MIYTAITIAVFSALSIIALLMHRNMVERKIKSELARRWEIIQKDANALYYLLHYSIKDLMLQFEAIQDNPVVVDLSIDMEKLGKPSDPRRLYATMIQIRDDLSKLSMALSEYKLYMRDDAVLAVDRLISELETFMELESKIRH